MTRATGTPAAAAEATPTPTPTPTPTASEDAPPAVPSGEPSDDASEEQGGLQTVGDDFIPAPPGAKQDAGPSAGQQPGQVQAEGSGAEEIAAAPVAPGADATPADGQVAAAGLEGQEVPPTDPAADPAAAAAAAEGVAPPPIALYGPQVVPSLGTAFAPNTNAYTGFQANAPLVLAPQIAGQQVAPNGPLTGPLAAGSSQDAAQSGIAAAVQPVRNVAAASLSIVQPSWFATTFALLILLAAACYGAVLRRRGETVPEAVAISGAIRPHDSAAKAVRSVRPGDLAVDRARSIRP